MLSNHTMRLPEMLFLLIHSAMCSAIHSSAVDTGTVIGLINPTLMKVVSDNMQTAREPSHSHLIRQSDFKIF
jgi:hypothetical protein